MNISEKEYRAIIRGDFMSFAERAFRELNSETTFVAGRQLELIAATLERCMRGEIRRLIVNLPPRSLKSLMCSVALPAWWLGNAPETKFICVSYGQELSDKLARDTRQLMSSPIYKRVFRTRLSSRQATADFETTGGGGRMATSVRGVLTGRGADVIIIDDPQKPDEALSETLRNGVNDWFDNSLLSRLNDKGKGCIIIVMQRLHQDDLVGHVLDRDPNWTVLSLPAIATENECINFPTLLGKRTFRRECGAALDPERESLETLAKLRRQLGEYNFLSQYQQTPQPRGGALVKTAWFRYYEPGEKPKEFDRIVQSWDTANKAGELNDFSVCTTWGIRDRIFYLLDVYRRKLNYPDLKRAVLELDRLYSPDTILIEDKASGTQLVQDLMNEGHRHVLAYKPPAGNDKIMRLHAQCALIENGAVRFPSQADWLAEYIDELISFPGSKFDDQVDSTTQALDHCKVPSGLEVWEILGRG